MPKKDSRIDDYIASAPDFAKPVLTRLRTLAHKACPAVEETMKWSMPHFMREGILFSMAAFKQRCAVHFWKGKLVLGAERNEGFGNLGRVTAMSGLPGDKVLLGYIKKAVKLNESGVKKPATRGPQKKLIVPDYFRVALSRNKKAQATFENFSYSHKKEYVNWISEAKREETRERRIKTALQWLAQGKPQNWKYLDC